MLHDASCPTFISISFKIVVKNSYLSFVPFILIPLKNTQVKNVLYDQGISSYLLKTLLAKLNFEHIAQHGILNVIPASLCRQTIKLQVVVL